MQLPKQITMKQYLHVAPGFDGEPAFSLYSRDITGETWAGNLACLGEVSLIIDVPQVDPVEKMIDALERQVESERAECQVRVNALLDRISKLRCLEHKPEAVE